MQTAVMDDNALAHYREHGYVILPEVLTSDECSEIKTALAKVSERSAPMIGCRKHPAHFPNGT